MARVVLVALAFGLAMPANAASSPSRVSILKYYLCLANPLVVDKTLCHL